MKDLSLQSYGQEITSKQLSHLQPKGFLDVFSSELLNLTRTSDIGRYGFPSGHTSGQFAIWIGLALLFRKKWLTILAITFVLLTMLSRMYLGVHYLGDVLGGLILGTMVTFPIYLFGSYLDGQHYSRSFIFGLLILLPLLSLESSGNWQASLLLGLNCTYLMFNMSGQLKLSHSTKHRALNSLVLIFIFLSGFTLVRALTKDLATLIEVISMFLLGTGVFSFQLFLARKPNGLSEMSNEILKLWIDIIGWIGSFEVIIAYFLISAHRIDANNIYYQILNGTGAAFLVINTIYYGAYPSTFINIVWLIIAGVAIIKMIFQRSSKS